MPESVFTGQFVITAMWILLSASLALSLLLGAILAYHWVRFSMNAFVASVSIVAYTGGCFLFLSGMLGAIVALS